MSEDNHEKYDGDLGNLNLNPIKDMLDAVVNSIILPFQQVVAKVREAVIGDALLQFQKTIQEFGKALQALVDPDISDEEIQQRISAYQTWGQHGWVIPPESPFDLFDTSPGDLKTANRIAMQYCRPQDIESIFSELEKQKHVRKADLQEAKFCFDNKKYKACVMILFSMIDARLIRLSAKQGREKQRPSGNRAANRLIEHIKQKYDDANYLFIVLRLAGLQACYDCIFAGGNDFKQQVPTINRNFIDHGMRWKRVTKTECIQVLLLYHETIKLLDFLNVKKMPVASGR